MGKYRRIYAGAFVLTLLLLIISCSRLFLLLLGVELLLPVLLEVLLRMDAKGLELILTTPSACSLGQQTSLQLRVNRHFPILVAAGVLEITLYYENRLVDLKRQQRLYLPISRKKKEFPVPFSPELCGEVWVGCEKLRCYDLFGLCGASLKRPRECRLTVYPDLLPIQLITAKNLGGWQGGDQNSKNRRGNDASEVYDLREYHPGDDIRSIHWKLSSKMQSLILKEASETFHYDTVLLFDAGMGDGEQLLEKELLSASAQLGVTLSAKLLELGISHDVLLSAGGELNHFPVSVSGEYQNVLEKWMGIPMQEKNGMGLRLFLLGQQMEYSKLIYVTAGNCPPELFSLASELSFTAICVKETGDEVKVAKKAGGQVIEISRKQLKEGSYRFFI